eukprot:1811078-Pyramimonas_sp.AAC.1
MLNTGIVYHHCQQINTMSRLDLLFHQMFHSALYWSPQLRDALAQTGKRLVSRALDEERTGTLSPP